ncbi:hypothetical protein BL254_21715 [Protofrankia sp. BMG5.30]|nr:hypothetical protein BL254_21715 [Protofrankia sp. BMG5.30]
MSAVEPGWPSNEAPPTLLRTAPSWLINKTALYSHRIIGEAFAAIGARRFHVGLLASLVEFGPSSQASLGRRCGFDRSDVAEMINELAEAGHVERTQDPSDRRRNIIQITDAGRIHLERLTATLDAAQQELVAPLSADERADLARLLGRVLDYQVGRHPL